ncbi:MAG TPA: CBS domain-containing protein [Methylomirabilota bacterium]|nr:CBS domain-containing protein [Methylomirabilota bacterium]
MSHALNPLEKIRTTKLDSLVTDLIEVPPDSNLRKVISIMAEKGVHEILIPDKNRCGMITAADALRASMETKPEALVSHIPVMTMETTVGEAARIMTDYKIGAVPVSDGRKITGQVTNSNLLHLLKGNLGDRRVSSISKESPVTMDAEDFAASARELFSRKRINHIPVKQRDKLVGLVTSTQILAVLPTRERVGMKSRSPETRSGLDFSLKDIMDSDPLTTPPQDSADETLNKLLHLDKTCVLVAQWDELQGIATRGDFVALLAEPQEKPEVPIYIVGLPDDPFEAEAAKQKFKRTINQLHKILPQILEARSVIKATASKPGKEKRRYEVRVHIKTPKNTYNYMASGWQLAEVYDTITDRLKRILSQKERRRRNQDVREHE